MQSEIDNLKKLKEKDHERIDKLERRTDILEHDIKDISQIVVVPDKQE
ncbi:hypothetical protein M3612_25005 [Niallia taxi]|nr:hypothetical protein [Niallia taxi]MCM3217732.1 hypothetical protein [Niallia taxi]